MDGSYLVLRGLHSWSVLSEDHGQGKEKHEQSVTHIAKHHRKEKGECDDGVGGCRQTVCSQEGSRRGLGIHFLDRVATEDSQDQPRESEAGTTWHISEPTTVNLCSPRLLI